MENKTICEILVVSIALVIVVSGVAVGANTRASDSAISISSSTIYVPDDYSKIQEAVDKVPAGGTVIVREDTYTENVHVNKRLMIKSEKGADKTIVHAFEVTADYVEIIGFTVEGPASEGIYLMNAEHCDIRDNVISDAYKGIELNASRNNNITNSIASGNHHGIYLSSSSNNNTLLNNIASNNDNQGITIESSSNNKIINNTVSNNWIGTVLEGSSKNTLISSDVSGNKHHNIRVSNSNSNNITNNSASNSGLGIYLRYSSSNNIAANKCLNNGWKGIRLLYSSNNQLISNNVSNGRKEGIYLDSYSSNNRLIRNDALNNNNHGIFLDFSSSNNRIINNTVDSNHYQGIHLESSSNNITGNKVSNNPWGIVLYSSNSKKNRLSNNTVWNNTRGICIGYSSNNTLIKNNVSDSADFGIYLESANNNTIYNNYFSNTNNSYDNGNNSWNITKTTGTNIVGGPYLGGNYWSDYDGTDLDGDMLGDTLIPYNCSGGIQNGGDWHPLIEIEKIILKASKDGYASVKHEIDNDENFERIEISGNVTDKSTGEPIEGAKVEIVKGAEPASTTTSAGGTYIITAIIPEGSGSDTREDINFELTPSQYIVGVYEITSEVIEVIEENNGTIIDQCQYEDGPRALLVYISEEENIDDFINNVQNSPLVKYVELNRIVHTCYVPNDPLYPGQWAPPNIRAGGPPNPSAWDVETGDKNITIAIVDTGIQYNHEDLYRFNDGTVKYVYGYDWVSMDDDPYPVMTIEAHGTHCAGVATAVMDNGKGIAGIAPNCSFIAERGFRMVLQFDPGIGWYWDGKGQVWNFSRAIMDAADHDANVISMSFGSPAPSEFERDATLYASSLGCILVAASGNGADLPRYAGGIAFPAAYPWVIAVGATDRSNERATFYNQNGDIIGGSQWGLQLELVAPGVDILSTVPWNSYINMRGTSMATPHVAGVAALVKSRAERWPEEPLATNPRYHLDNRQIRQVLIQSAVDLGSPGWDEEYGYGKVDAGRAVRCVNISGNLLEALLNAPIPHPPEAPAPPEVRVTSIEGPPGIYTTNENTTLARITPDGDYFVMVPPGVYSICAMAYGYIPPHGLGGERVDLPAFDLMGRLNEESRGLSLVPFPCNVTGNVTDSVTGLPIEDASISLDGPPHIYPPHPNVHMETEADSNGNYHFILEYGVHPPYPTGEAVYNITVRKSGYQTQTQNFTLNWSDVVTDYYKCPLDPNDYNPPIVNFSMLSGASELQDLMLTSDDIQVIFNENATVSATIHNIGTTDASNIVVQFFDGDPDAGGTQIGTDQTISSIAHESTGTAQVLWTAIPGTHDISVRVDPYDSVSESREDNNQAYKQITVSGVKTIYVDDDFTDDPANHRWDTIQEGITDANDGDTVLVYNGTYTETVDLNKRLTLLGEGMPEIDAQSLGDAINITADNCTVRGFSCVNAYPFSYVGIRVESNNNVIEENTCKDNDVGIYLSGSSNDIRNNSANYNYYPGIGLWASSENIIANNMAKNNGGNGIFLKDSNNNRITDNDASNNDYHGISLNTSNSNEIRNETANRNHYQGVRLWASSENIIANTKAKNNGANGIFLSVSNNNRITDNDASNNDYDGILLESSNNNAILKTTVNSNNRCAIYLLRSSNNNIYLNNFIANIYNAYSYNSSNIWHSKSKITYTYNSQSHTNFMGNYWSDYKGSDTDGDGIGEDPYSIDGDKDYYPLMERFENLA